MCLNQAKTYVYSHISARFIMYMLIRYTLYAMLLMLKNKPIISVWSYFCILNGIHVSPIYNMWNTLHTKKYIINSAQRRRQYIYLRQLTKFCIHNTQFQLQTIDKMTYAKWIHWIFKISFLLFLFRFCRMCFYFKFLQYFKRELIVCCLFSNKWTLLHQRMCSWFDHIWLNSFKRLVTAVPVEKLLMPMHFRCDTSICIVHSDSALDGFSWIYL